MKLKKKKKRKMEKRKSKNMQIEIFFMPSVSHPSYVKIQETINNSQKEENN